MWTEIIKWTKIESSSSLCCLAHFFFKDCCYFGNVFHKIILYCVFIRKEEAKNLKYQKNLILTFVLALFTIYALHIQTHQKVHTYNSRHVFLTISLFDCLYKSDAHVCVLAPEHTHTEEVPKFQFLFSVIQNTISDMHVIKGIRNAMCCVIANAALRPLQNNYYRKNAVISLGTKSRAPMSPNLRSW